MRLIGFWSPNMDPNEATGSPLRHRRRRYYSLLPCFSRSGSSSSSSSSGLSWWQKIRAANIGCNGNRSLWSRGVGALRKIREWSEIVAGPRWKTFIRRFKRHRHKPVNAAQYDPLSYALNFDEGCNSISNADNDPHYYASRNFSSRYANGSIDRNNNDEARV